MALATGEVSLIYSVLFEKVEFGLKSIVLIAVGMVLTLGLYVRIKIIEKEIKATLDKEVDKE